MVCYYDLNIFHRCSYKMNLQKFIVSNIFINVVT